jgi:hypothetical protein
MNDVIEERWMFTIKRYPDGRCYATAPFKLGQNVAQPKKQKQAPAQIQVAEAPKTAKPLWGN